MKKLSIAILILLGMISFSSAEVGLKIGISGQIGEVDIDGEEYYGTIVEFDDDEDTVTIEEEESGDEITAYQDEMFVPED